MPIQSEFPDWIKVEKYKSGNVLLTFREASYARFWGAKVRVKFTSKTIYIDHKKNAYKRSVMYSFSAEPHEIIREMEIKRKRLKEDELRRAQVWFNYGARRICVGQLYSNEAAELVRTLQIVDAMVRRR